MRTALGLLLGVGLVCVASASRAEDKKPAEVTFKGTIVCTKCELGETPACGNAIKTKIDGKDVVVYFMDMGAKEAYHKMCCKKTPMGSVTGVVTEKDKKKYITPAKDGVKFE